MDISAHTAALAGGMSLLMFKPDGVALGCHKSARQLAAEAGLELAESWPFRLELGHIVGLWPQVDASQRPITHALFRHYLESQTVLVDAYRGAAAIDACLRIKDVLRRDHNDFIYMNTVHAPDRLAEVVSQYALLRGKDSPRAAGELVPARWSRWKREEIYHAVAQVWRWIGAHHPVSSHWALCGKESPGALELLGPAQGGGLATYVTEDWKLGFDQMVAAYADILAIDELAVAMCASLAALYDASGFFVPRARRTDLARAQRMLEAVGVRGVYVPHRSLSAAALSGLRRWSNRLEPGPGWSVRKSGRAEGSIGARA